MGDSIKVGPLEFVEGGEYVRRDIHDAIGGQWQGGISTPSKYPVVLIFTSDTGQDHGYGFDGWQSADVFHYTGEGQPASGDMRFTRGNKAIRDHIQDGKRLLLFKHVTNTRSGKRRVEFVSEMEYRGHDIKMRDSAGYGREVIVFTLVPVMSNKEETKSGRAESARRQRTNEAGPSYDEDIPFSVTLRRWEWDEILLSLSRYVQMLEGDPEAAFESDVEWAEELGHQVKRLQDAIAAGQQQGS